jgi:predicted ABC-type ATPase
MIGGHDVPEAVVRRRYWRGLRNFFELYQPLATTWRVYDSAVSHDPVLIAAGRGHIVADVTDFAKWERIRRGPYGSE